MFESIKLSFEELPRDGRGAGVDAGRGGMVVMLAASYSGNMELCGWHSRGIIGFVHVIFEDKDVSSIAIVCEKTNCSRGDRKEGAGVEEELGQHPERKSLKGNDQTNEYAPGAYPGRLCTNITWHPLV